MTEKQKVQYELDASGMEDEWVDDVVGLIYPGKGEGGRIGYENGGRQYPGPHLPDRAFYEPHRQKTRKPYESIEDIPPEILVMLMKDPNFDPDMFMDIEWSEPEGTWYKGGHDLRGAYYGHDDPNINIAQVEMGDKPARHPEAELEEEALRKIHLNLLKQALN